TCANPHRHHVSCGASRRIGFTRISSPSASSAAVCSWISLSLNWVTATVAMHPSSQHRRSRENILLAIFPSRAIGSLSYTSKYVNIRFQKGQTPMKCWQTKDEGEPPKQLPLGSQRPGGRLAVAPQPV